MNNLVTVCITTYNRKELLPLTLKSVLNQTYKNIEIIIVDDYSTDGTKELVESELLKLDNRIRYIRHKKNKGLASGRNTAINNAKGKYFTFCDDDDEWMPNFIEEFVKVADEYDDSWCFTCGNIYYKKNQINFRISNYKKSLKELIYDGFTPPVASQFYNLSSLLNINGYDENIKSGVDHDLWLRLASSNINILNIGKALSRPNINTLQSRMTKNEEVRISGIKDSLERWKLLVSNNFSEDFYIFFKRNYFYYLNKSFLKQSILKKDYKKAFIYLYKIDKYFIILDFKKTFLKKLFSNKLFPLFFRYHKEFK